MMPWMCRDCRLTTRRDVISLQLSWLVGITLPFLGVFVPDFPADAQAETQHEEHDDHDQRVAGRPSLVVHHICQRIDVPVCEREK